MAGNVYEWCQDWYNRDYYSDSPSVNPTGPDTGTERVVRGGSWDFTARFCRVSGRRSYHPNGGYVCNGLRLVLDNVETYTVNGATFKMINVEGGTFTMGASDNDTEAYDNEKPAHQVTLSNYSIGETEVTQELWVAVMGNNPSSHKGDMQYPVENVSWVNCQTFIDKLNEMTGKTFRLTTEAEWEYAARGGNMSHGYLYAGSNNIDEVAWYRNNSNAITHPVSSKLPNELGLYDMSGNVYEWCQDWYEDYSSAHQTNPTGPASGVLRIGRGGGASSFGYAKYCRVTYRDKFSPSYVTYVIGLRLAM